MTDRTKMNSLTFEYDKFDLVRTLMQTETSSCGTKLARAQSETEKQDIENLMSNDSKGAYLDRKSDQSVRGER